MALICNDCTVVGKSRQIWCDITGEPCMHVRYCGVSGKYYQTDNAKRCKAKEKQHEKK